MVNHSSKGYVLVQSDVLCYHSTSPLLIIMFSIALHDSCVLTKWFLIEVLKCHFNESADNISEDIRAVVYSIRNMDVEKYF